MNFKLLKMSVLVSTLALAMGANAAVGVKNMRNRPKTTTKTATKVQENTRAAANPKAVQTPQAAKGFDVNANALLGISGKTTKQDELLCSGTSSFVNLIADSMPSESQKQEVLKASETLKGKVQRCQAGEALNAEARVAMGTLMINVAKKVEKGADASDKNVWAEGLQELFASRGTKLSLEQALENVIGLASNQCKMITNINI